MKVVIIVMITNIFTEAFENVHETKQLFKNLMIKSYIFTITMVHEKA
jgi:hypothetical protein